MQIVQVVTLINQGDFEASSEWNLIQTEIREAIQAITYPPGNSCFTINPTRHGNGVKPIKDACMITLRDRFDWKLETKITYATRSPGKVDATKALNTDLFALEWETGNISSSHRAMNKLVLGFLRGVFLGAALVLPSRKFYHYLTDRIGNYEELEPYFDIWRSIQLTVGFLAIFVIEHDEVDPKVPTITKGTDGRALI